MCKEWLTAAAPARLVSRSEDKPPAHPQLRQSIAKGTPATWRIWQAVLSCCANASKVCAGYPFLNYDDSITSSPLGTVEPNVGAAQQVLIRIFRCEGGNAEASGHRDASGFCD
jgi:hypothetical protein